MKLICLEADKSFILKHLKTRSDVKIKPTFKNTTFFQSIKHRRNAKMLFMLSALLWEIHLLINNNECVIKNDLHSFVVKKALAMVEIALLGKKKLDEDKIKCVGSNSSPKRKPLMFATHISLEKAHPGWLLKKIIKNPHNRTVSA